MALSIEDVRRIALLARLRLSPEEEEKFVSQLGKIVEYIDQLSNFSSAVEAPGHTAGREASPSPESDRAVRSVPQEDLLGNAPAVMDRFFLVPRVKGSSDE